MGGVLLFRRGGDLLRRQAVHAAHQQADLLTEASRVTMALDSTPTLITASRSVMASSSSRS
jgi:hypothetical protein